MIHPQWVLMLILVIEMDYEGGTLHLMCCLLVIYHCAQSGNNVHLVWYLIVRI